jgi:hypothetical protein
MATMINQDEPFQITTSRIQQTGSDDDPYNDILYYENTEMKEDNLKLKTATAQLQEELDKVKAELTQINLNLNKMEQTPRTTPPITGPQMTHTATTTYIQDLFPPSPNLDTKRNNVSDEATLQAKLAKELIKLANSYKFPELTFDIQASKRRYNFSTWFTKLQTILSMFPQTSNVIQDSGMIMFYPNSNDFGNKALFLLIGAKVDNYFQRAIRPFAGQCDKALAFFAPVFQTRIEPTSTMHSRRCELKKTNPQLLLLNDSYLPKQKLNLRELYIQNINWLVLFLPVSIVQKNPNMIQPYIFIV